MAVGTVQSAGSGAPPLVSVLKLADISNPIHSKMWPLDVAELKAVIKELNEGTT